MRAGRDLFGRQLELSDFKNSIALLRDMVIFFAIASYFMGWVYLNEYLSAFGLYLANIEIPLYYYFIFSYPPLLSAWHDPSWADLWRLIAVCIAVGACITAYRVRLMAGYFGVIACFLCIIVVGFGLAVEKSKEHARYVLAGGGKQIGFVFDEEIVRIYGPQISTSLLAANEKGHLRLVWSGETETYAVDVGPEAPAKATYRVPHNTFVFSRVFGNVSGE